MLSQFDAKKKFELRNEVLAVNKEYTKFAAVVVTCPWYFIVYSQPNFHFVLHQRHNLCLWLHQKKKKVLGIFCSISHQVFIITFNIFIELKLQHGLH